MTYGTSHLAPHYGFQTTDLPCLHDWIDVNSAKHNMNQLEANNVSGEQTIRRICYYFMFNSYIPVGAGCLHQRESQEKHRPCFEPTDMKTPPTILATQAFSPQIPSQVAYHDKR
jgi:hypothetical protein